MYAFKYYISCGHCISGKMKFFLGHSGWIEGQLAQDINGDSWVVGTADDEHLFSANGDAFWKYSVNRLGHSYKNWNQFPRDPRLN